MLISAKRIGPAESNSAGPIPTNERNAGSNPPPVSARSLSSTDLDLHSGERKHHGMRARLQKVDKPPQQPELYYAWAWAKVRITEPSERPARCKGCMFYSAATDSEGLCVPPTMSPSLVADIGGDGVVVGRLDSACKQSLSFPREQKPNKKPT